MDENWGQGSINNDIGWGQGAINNDINWGYSHFNSSSGDTNITGQGSSPAMERYYITSCTSFPNQVTTDYAVGTYQIGDRVLYNSNDGNQYGHIDSITTNEQTENTFIYDFLGINSNNCYDNNINIDFYLEADGGDIIAHADILPQNEDFASDQKNTAYQSAYTFTYNWFVGFYYINEEYNEGEVYYGNNSVGNSYYFPSNEWNSLVSEIIYSGPIIIYLSQIYLNETVNLENSYAFSDNYGCDTRIFMRNNGDQIGKTVHFNLTYVCD